MNYCQWSDLIRVALNVPITINFILSYNNLFGILTSKCGLWPEIDHKTYPAPSSPASTNLTNINFLLGSRAFPNYSSGLSEDLIFYSIGC